ncbi:MAG: phosphomannomutase/phosphoglucomutase [Magnetococcales bacterium]|nr:phosphomannomutase/phosphoglucomutase [Magnetococcales bacterium]
MAWGADMDLHPHMFREYDIRGIAGVELTPRLVEELGRVFAALAREAAGSARGQPLSVAVGRDGRLSSPELGAALTRGLAAGGLRVIDLGLTTSPGLYFATHHCATDAGIMITGSHNPPDYNGLKMVRFGAPFFGAGIQEIRQRLEAGGAAPVPGGTVEQQSILDAHVARMTADFRPGRRVKVVLDCGNGAAGPVAQALLQRLPGIEGEVLFPEPDGRFPNHHPDPTLPENLEYLRRRMTATGAELGIAFDGDGDRLGALDEQGRIVWGDRLMILFARQLLRESPGATIIGDVKCSQLLFDAVAAAGGRPLMWKTGHSLIKAKMKETGAPLSGEMSGHLFFADRYLGFDDALYGAMRLMELVASEPTPLSRRLADLPTVHATPELRIDCPDDRKFQVMERIARDRKAAGGDIAEVDGIRVRLPDGAWWLLRVSNTQPALVARVEARSPERLAEVADQVARLLQAQGVAFPSWQAS